MRVVETRAAAAAAVSAGEVGRSAWGAEMLLMKMHSSVRFLSCDATAAAAVIPGAAVATGADQSEVMTHFTQILRKWQSSRAVTCKAGAEAKKFAVSSRN